MRTMDVPSRRVAFSAIPLIAMILFSVTGCVKNVAVTGISLDKKSLALTVGESANLVATVEPAEATDGSFSWTSSNTAVATVNGGLVKAVSAGTADVTVTTADGGKTDVCRVTVAEKVINVTGVTLDKDKLMLYEGAKDTLAATVAPSDATDPAVTWKSSDEAVATVDGQGAVTAVKAGSATVTVTTNDGAKSASCALTVVANVVSDDKLKELVLGEFDKDGDGFLSDAETETVKKLDCKGKGIKSLEGIEKFTQIETIDCSGNEIESIDLRNNKNLVTVDCSKNALRSLKVGGLTKLEMINCSGNKLDTINISENEVLTDLDCSDNQLVAIVFDKAASAPSFSAVAQETRPFAVKESPLKKLNVSKNNLAELGIASLVKMTDLDCSGNNLKTLDATNMAFKEGAGSTYSLYCGSQLVGTLTLTIREDMAEYWLEKLAADLKNEGVTLYIPVRGITISESSANLKVGETTMLTAAVTPDVATNKKVTWKSGDAEIVSVSSSASTLVATVKALKVGKAVVTATTEDGGKTAECTFEIAPADILVKGLSLDRSTMALEVGQTGALTAKVDPADATNDSVYWAVVDTNIIKVSSVGSYLDAVVTAVGVGSSTVMAWTADGDFKASCEVTVSPKTIFVTGVTLDKTSLKMIEGEDAELVATVAPEDASNQKISWMSSDPKVVAVASITGSVNAAGLSALAAGTATITVTTEDGTFTAACEVTVEAATVAVTAVKLDRDTMIMTAGDAARSLIATVSPEDATNKEVTWTSSDPKIASVEALPTAAGLAKVTPLAEGDVVITATTTDGGLKAVCNVRIKAKAVAVTGVKLDRTKLNMVVGYDSELEATVVPDNATNKNVTWTSSSPQVVTVDEGKLSAVSAGTATITVTTEDGTFTATCEVTVEAASVTVDVTGVKLSASRLGMVVGETQSLTATVLPSDASNDKVTWESSDEAVVKIAAANSYLNVIISAVGAGEAVITATTEDGGKTAQCYVSVSPENVAVTGVRLDKDTVLMSVGGVGRLLVAYVLPNNATNMNVTWESSSPEIVNVQDNGILGQAQLTAYQNGMSTITVTTEEGGYKATCNVTVGDAEVKVTGITLDASQLDLTLGTSGTLTASVSPSNASNNKVVWISSNESAVTVAAANSYLTVIVNAVGTGGSTITATTEDGGYSAECYVGVLEKFVTGITLDESQFGMMKTGDTRSVTATIEPVDATDQRVDWTSSDESVVYVEGAHDGTSNRVTVIRANNIGDAVITATSVGNSAKTASYTVRVRQPYYGSANCVLAYDKSSVSIDITPHITDGQCKPSSDAADAAFAPAAAVADVLWRETSLSRDPDLSISGNTLTVSGIRGTGNALVAIREKASGDILWSYHIWVPEEDPTETLTYPNTKSGSYEVMPLALGATKTVSPYLPALSQAEQERGYYVKGAEDSILTTFGLFYQWGRKDPLGRRGSKYGESFGFVATQPEVSWNDATVGSSQSILYSVKNPTIFIDATRDWINFTNDNLWGNSGGFDYPKNGDTYKSVYDPCPAGYKVAPPDLWRNFITADGERNTFHFYDTKQQYWYTESVFYFGGDGSVIADFYPKPWYRGSQWNTAGLLYWSSSPTSATSDGRYALCLDDPFEPENLKSCGFAVRCIREE